MGRFFDGLFGLLTLLLGLAILSAIPLLNFLSLGYLLEASARVARSGKIRSGLIGLIPAAAVGKIIAAAWILFLPIRLIYGFWQDSRIVAPEGQSTAGLAMALTATVTLAILTLMWTIHRGGKIRHWFPTPLRFVRWLGEPKAGAASGICSSWTWVWSKRGRLWHYFKLGFLGFCGALLWLILPVMILFGAAQIPNPGLSFLVSLVGAMILAALVMPLPFIQVRFAMTGNFAEFFRWREVRENFGRAPLAFWLALLVTLLFALPLYLLKIEMTPREVAWIPNLVFVVFMLPARLLAGWALSRSLQREIGRHWVWTWLGRLGMLPAAAVYVLIVWLAQFLGWHGSYSLFEQHAFLLPAPFFGY